MKKIAPFVLALILVVSCKNKNTLDPVALAVAYDEINIVYDKINSAFINKDGTSLYDNLDQESIEYYEGILTAVKTKNIDGTLVDQMNIANGLLLLSDEDLQTIDTKKFVEILFLNSAVDDKKIEVLSSAVLANLEIEENTATGTIFGIQPANFFKEKGQWKYSLLDSRILSETVLREAQEANNMTNKEFLIMLLSTSEFTQNPNIKRDFTEVFNLIQEERQIFGDKA
ncbi:hypothetical protein [Myroides odoratus]|uniref:Uncharacterized protein n=1 Tax=Myroides odoratus TaxID=256 RepID=A0A9Q6ZDK1_MYROD|nr:hypothetical protein [Myroides odoratus]EHQ43354.1 hypothetical protein Myrod_2533 [Myroides odoratus DSM 2801]EKB06741.1 hypothetical protein HMPREF9716_02396 [Myroides odoratus CIP 103059]QQU00696.1 hypothetical protein I6I88_02670 [Myroides odoratus]WQD57069.1 hypothetical protein U0010_16365 [Myroides odoratus]STZ30631.1 Uncharacterised protein [Myroides odoratus]